jgi:hypothetical protein
MKFVIYKQSTAYQIQPQSPEKVSHFTLFLPVMGGISPYMSVTWQQAIGIGLRGKKVTKHMWNFFWWLGLNLCTPQLNFTLIVKIFKELDFDYHIVASTNTCYYSENEIFFIFKVSNSNMPQLFSGKKLSCLLSKLAEKKDTWQTHDVFVK